ncbi:MAG: hypothetical protein ACFCU1_12120 [Sumerlaeia bacterium]
MPTRFSQYVSFELSSPNTTKIEVDLGLIIGAVSVQQQQEPGFPSVWMLY